MKRRPYWRAGQPGENRYRSRIGTRLSRPRQHGWRQQQSPGRRVLPGSCTQSLPDLP